MSGRRAAALLCCAALGCVDVPVSVGSDRSSDSGAGPRIAYLDLVAGPTSGGEGDLGAYLSIFGQGFGAELGALKVRLGGQEVASYRSLGPSKGRSDLQQLTVQLGPLGGAPPGAVLPVTVELEGRVSNADHRFTVQPGDILFVDSVRGDDAAAVKNDPLHPWRSVQTPSNGGALAAAQAGDVLVLRGGRWSDTGYDQRWIRLRFVTGSEPTGAKGSGYLSIVAYPGEDVHFIPPAGPSFGGIHGLYGPNPGVSKWIVISGLRIEGGGPDTSDGPINLQTESDHWRIVNNELGPWDGPSSAHSGGIAGNGSEVVILGNHIHDIGGGTNNCIGLDTGSVHVEVAYNHLEGCTSGSAVQTFDNLGVALDGIRVHHNLLHRAARHGVILAQGTRSARVFNNLIYDIDASCVRIHQSASGLDTEVSHNTLVGCCRAMRSGDGAVANTSNAEQGAVTIRDNLVVRGAEAACAEGYQNSGIDSALSLQHNLWFGYSPPPRDGSALILDPRLVDPAQGDLHLSAGSPAEGASSGSAPVDDYELRPRGAPADLGALER